MRIPTAPRLRAACAALIAIGCAKHDKHAGQREAVERHRGEVEETFAALAKLEAAPLPPARDELAYSGAPLTHADTIVLPAGADVIAKLRLDHFETVDPLFDNSYVREVSYQLHGRFLGSAADIERGLTEFAGTRYVILVKTLQRGSRDSSEQLVAEAHLFGIGGRYYGGLRFEARESASGDLRDSARKAMHDRLVQRIPGSEVP
jgi:hypothetical protein